MKIIIISVLLSILAGFGGGWAYQATMGGKSETAKTSTGTSATTSSSTAKTQTFDECLTEVWGADKYAAITTNPNLATTDDNLARLKCYN